MYERMTDYSLGDLRKMVATAGDLRCGGEDGLRGLPVGAVLNEIGIIFLNGNMEAEQDLANLFQDNDPIVNATAYFYLSQRMDAIGPVTRSLVESFANNPDNAKIVHRANKKIKELQTT